MTTMLSALLFLHIVAGFLGLAAFWVPLFVKKGAPIHVRSGRVFTWCAYVVSVTAVVLAADRAVSYRLERIALTDRPDLYGFAYLLGYLGVVTFASVRQAIRAVATRKTPDALASPFHLALTWASIAGSAGCIAVAFTAWSEVSPILLGMSPVGVIVGSTNLRVIRRPKEHMALVLQPPRFHAGGRDRVPHRVPRLRVRALRFTGPLRRARRAAMGLSNPRRHSRHRALDPVLPPAVQAVSRRRPRLTASRRPKRGIPDSPCRVHYGGWRHHRPPAPPAKAGSWPSRRDQSRCRRGAGSDPGRRIQVRK